MRSNDPTPRSPRFFLLVLALGMGALLPVGAHAQTDAEEDDDVLMDDESESSGDEVAEDEDYDDEAYEDEDYDEDELDEDEGDLQLRAPSVGMPSVGGRDEDEDYEEDEDYDADEEYDEELDEEEEAEEEDDGWAESDPIEDDADLLENAAPIPSADPTVGDWGAPRSTFTLHGYFRLRGELQDNFFLSQDNRPGATTSGNPVGDPTFAYWVPADRDVELEGTEGRENGTDRLRYGTMRFRAQPTLALSDDVRVHVTLDVFDNLVLGSTPESLIYDPNDPSRLRERSLTVPVDAYSGTQTPPQGLRNSFRDGIVARRAWAEVTNRGIGQLRFGRMATHWGLGMQLNSGDDIDGDFSSEVDRVMYIARFEGYYFMGAYDFASQGIQQGLTDDLRSTPFDLTSIDDLRQYAFAVAKRTEDREAREELASGGWVLDYGLHFMFQRQNRSIATTGNELGATTGVGADFNDSGAFANVFISRGARIFTPNVWGRFRWGSLRLELEAALVAGEIDDIDNESNDEVAQSLQLLQYGFAFESEYRLLNDKLYLRLYTGLASGDAGVDGLSQRNDLLGQRNEGAGRASAYSFHPNYRVDLILFRNILGAVSSAYYLKPGLGYDIIRSPFGQLFGASVDMIFSRALHARQTYSGFDDADDPAQNLGVELDFSLYYRSEDGPLTTDGFYAQFNYGLLFPLAGLDLPVDGGLGRAQTLRLLLGVIF
ncbi:MAG: TIGR04551 family protein [Myxococcota bacterium]